MTAIDETPNPATGQTTMDQPNPARSPDEVDLSVFGASHVRLYRETRGEQGYIWNGAPTLLLTNRGRKSGQMRTTPLIFVTNGGDPVVVASKAAPRSTRTGS